MAGGRDRRRGDLVARGGRGLPRADRGVNPRINAVVRLADDARDRARAADAELARGARLGPLHGVPFTIKDSLDTAGVVTTAGTAGWRERVPERDATVVARLREAGGILLGKTNTPEFTWANETDNDVYGRTSNPYDLERSRAAAAAARRRSSRPVARRSTSAATAATASGSLRTCAGSPASSRRAAACRGPATGPATRACSSRSPSWARSPAGSRTSRSSCALIAGPDGEDPHIARSPLRDPSRRRLAAPGRLVRRQRHPDAHARDDGRGPGGGRRDRGDRGDDRGAGAARPSRRPAGVGGGHPRRRLRLAVAAHRAGRDARATARTTGSGGSRCARASRSRATR